MFCLPSKLDECDEEYACYNSFYAHLISKHPGTFTCCNQQMALDEATITDHLSTAHRSLEVFQCLKCNYGANNVNDLRLHMSIAHASSYLFAGVRRKFESDAFNDDIQVIYIGDAQDITPYNLIKCSQLSVLNEMDPRVLVLNQQFEALQILHLKCTNIKTKSTKKISAISNLPEEISLKFIKYERYAQLKQEQKLCASLVITYKCITHELANKVAGTVGHFDPKPCASFETNDQLLMVRHRNQMHQDASAIVFLQYETQILTHVKKIVRCSYECLLCAKHCVTHHSLVRHFNSYHPSQLLMSKVRVNSHVIDSNDPSQPLGMVSESFEYFLHLVLKCAQSNCIIIDGTNSQAITHYNEHHNGIGSKIDGFEAVLKEKIVETKRNDIDLYVDEVRKSSQLYLLECQHCQLLFNNLEAIDQHFSAVQMGNATFQPRFIVRKLYGCLEDNRIRTFAGMELKARQHHGKKSFHPVDVLFPKRYCGLCGYDYSKNHDLDAHFASVHGDGETYNSVLLAELQLKSPNDIEQCTFTTGCCGNNEYSCLRHIVDHALKCGRRFVCTQCTQQKFNDAPSFVMHFAMEHHENVDLVEIVGCLQDFKKFFVQLFGMQIIRPNGFVVTLREIRDTLFGSALQFEIGNLVFGSWISERMVLDRVIASIKKRNQIA